MEGVAEEAAKLVRGVTVVIALPEAELEAVACSDGADDTAPVGVDEAPALPDSLFPEPPETMIMELLDAALPEIAIFVEELVKPAATDDEKPPDTTPDTPLETAPAVVSDIISDVGPEIGPDVAWDEATDVTAVEATDMTPDRVPVDAPDEAPEPIPEEAPDWGPDSATLLLEVTTALPFEDTDALEPAGEVAELADKPVDTAIVLVD